MVLNGERRKCHYKKRRVLSIEGDSDTMNEVYISRVCWGGKHSIDRIDKRRGGN